MKPWYFEDESRGQYSYQTPPAAQEINSGLLIGCLQRIARSLETISKPIARAEQEKAAEAAAEQVRDDKARAIRAKEGIRSYEATLSLLSAVATGATISRIRGGLWRRFWYSYTPDATDFPPDRPEVWPIAELWGVGLRTVEDFDRAIAKLKANQEKPDADTPAES